MPFQVSPGVVVTERDLTTVVPNVATSIGAIAGEYQWGPVLERVRITTENELVRVFGKPNLRTSADYWTAANYLSYTNNLIVVRNVNSDAYNATVGDDDAAPNSNNVKMYNLEEHDKQTDAVFQAGSDCLFLAKYPGEFGNSLKVLAIDKHGWDLARTAYDAGTATADQTTFITSFDGAPGTSTDVTKAGGSMDEMHIIVIDEDGDFAGEPGEVLDRDAYFSKAVDAKRIDVSSNYVGNVLRSQSQYIWMGDKTEFTANSTGAGSDVGAAKTSTFKQFNNATVAKTILGGSLTGGTAGSIATDGQRMAAYDMFGDVETVDITLVMSGAGNTVVGRYIVDNIAGTRKDCVAFVSPNKASVVHPASQSAAVTALKTDNTNLGSSNYAVMDGAWKYQYDRYRDEFIYVPMNGDMAGLCARTDYTNDPWWSPAGYTRGTVKNILRPSWEPRKADRDEMYKVSINPIITQPGAGVLLFGDKTMQVIPSAFDRINVRRLFIVLEKAISIAAKSLLFEFNDEFTRAQFVNIVSPFLREVQGRRGITDFKVVCDTSNNTGQVIDTNNFVGDIYIKPARSINFIQLNFIAARTDVSFSEIGG